MDDSSGVRLRQSVGGLSENSEQTLERRAPDVNLHAQRRALEQLHGNVVDRLTVSLTFADLMNSEDVGMIER